MSAATRKPKIIICGQKSRRHEEFERQFGGRARISFFREGNLHQLCERARSADAVFISVHATDHKTQFMVEKAGLKPRIVGGGAVQLKDAIESYLVWFGC